MSIIISIAPDPPGGTLTPTSAPVPALGMTGACECNPRPCPVLRYSGNTMKWIAISLCFLFVAGCTMQTAQTLPAQAHPKAQVPLYNVARLPGTYFYDNGMGSSNRLTLHLGNTFGYRSIGCFGEVSRFDGIWRLEGDVMILEPTQDDDDTYPFSRRLIPVPWGERMYLVDENAVPAFAADARGGKVLSAGVHEYDYVQVDPESHEVKPMAGIPVFPERYLVFYEKGAVAMKVIELMPDGTVILDKGRKDGLRPGLVVGKTGEFMGSDVDILELTQTTAIGRPIYYSNSDKEVLLGDEFTTGSGWSRPTGTGWKRFGTVQSSDLK